MKDEVLKTATVFNGRYQVVRCIKAGGMGAVYEVVHIETQRRRALKVMLPDLVENASARERFRLEATVAAEIESEHIVETFDAGVDKATGSPFLVMEMLRGLDLGELAERRRLTPGEVVAVLGQASLALAKTHARGIVHRDLKPENLFLTFREDGSLRVKVLDFGIAKLVRRATVAQGTQTVGTPPFMSPEQIEGAATIGPQSDVYALAHIAYALLVGRLYFDSDDAMAIIAQALRGPTEAPSVRAGKRGVTLPPGFDAWFMKGAAPLVEARFQTAPHAISALALTFGFDGFDARTTGSFAMSLEAVVRGCQAGLRASTQPSPVLRLLDQRTAPLAAAPPAVQVTGQPVSSDRTARAPSAPRGVVIPVALALALAALATSAIVALRGRAPSDAASSPAASSLAAPVSAPASAPAPTPAPTASVAPAAETTAPVPDAPPPPEPSVTATATVPRLPGRLPPRARDPKIARPTHATEPPPAPIPQPPAPPIDPTRMR